MAAYRADIEIGVRGQRDLERLRSLITQTTQAFESLNRIASTRGGLNQTLTNYTNQVNRAKTAIDNVIMGTQAETKAIREYVTAIGAANTARARQNYLIAQEIANRRQVQTQINAGFGVQGPALPPGMAARSRRNAGPGTGRLGGVISNAVIGGAFPLLFGQGGGAATGGAIGGIAGGLFGGAGGFAGSLLGTLLGGIVEQGAKVRQLAEDIGFSAEQTKRLENAFALAGAEADKFEASVQNIRGLGLTLDDQADAISLVSKLTESYGGKIDRVTAAYADFVEKGKVGIADINKFTSQGIPILEALEKKFGTNRDGVLALAKDGKISAQELSDALVSLAQTSDAVNKKVKTGWDKVWEDLSIGSSKSVKGIIAVFSSLIGASSNISGSIASVFSGLYRQMIEGALDAGARISRTLAATARAAANYAATFELGGINIGASAAKGTAKGAERIFTNLDQQLQQIRNTPTATVGAITVPGQAPGPAGKKGPKPPEDRTAQLREEFNAIVAIGKAEDKIRDLRFQGRDILVAQAEYEKEIADITRDKNKALLQANYASEKIVINKIAEARTVKATLELEDKLREIEADRNRLALEREFAREQQRRSFEKDMAGLVMPGMQTDMEQLLINQAQRREQLLGERFTRLDQIQRQLAAAPGTFKPNEIKELQKQLVDVNNEIGKLTDGLVQVDAAEIAWERNRAGVEALQTALNGIGTSLTNVFSDLIFGTDSWNNSLRNALNSLSNLLFQAGLSALAGSDGVGFFSFLTGGLKKRALGGPVTQGEPYLVGERGPELFVPGRSGTIVPNNAMGSGSVQVGTINISVENTGDQLSPQAQKQIAGQVRGIVLATLVDQQRSGGVLR